MSDNKESAPAPAPAAAPSQALALSGPYAALIGIVMALFGTGGVWSVEGLKTAVEATGVKLEAQTAKLADVQLTLSKIEARNAATSEAQSVLAGTVARHDDRLRICEAEGAKRQFVIDQQGRQIDALTKTVEELRRATPR